MMRTVLMLLGLAGFVAGLLFAAQGAGIMTWPQQGAMVNNVEWIPYGLIIAGLSLVLFGFGARRPR